MRVNEELLAQRYGIAPTATVRRRMIVGIGALTILAAMVFGWIAIDRFSPQANFENATHSIVSDTSVAIAFNVNKPADRSARCVIVAENRTHAQVGWIEVEVGPAEQNRVQVSTSVATSERAALAKVTECHLVD